MTRYRITYRTGWRDLGYDDTTTKEVVCRNFDEAYHKAQTYDWNPDICVKIVAIEEIGSK
jgi:hypothetical protein